jgi:DNA-binding NarL/FixJ family response regulator
MHALDAILRARSPAVALTIVVADDDPDFREVVRYLLTAVADTITVLDEAPDGQKALDLVLRERPDLVITDLMMPRLNGVELTKRIRQELPETKIILVSSYPEDQYRLMAADSGADAFVNKRVISDALLPAIRDVVRRRFSGGNGSLPPTEGGSSALAVLPC